MTCVLVFPFLSVCVTVVLASEGYPRAYEKGKVITGIDAADALDDVHAVRAERDGDRAGKPVPAG